MFSEEKTKIPTRRLLYGMISVVKLCNTEKVGLNCTKTVPNKVKSMAMQVRAVAFLL